VKSCDDDLKIDQDFGKNRKNVFEGGVTSPPIKAHNMRQAVTIKLIFHSLLQGGVNNMGSDLIILGWQARLCMARPPLPAVFGG
jgi:hypothetical protein